MSAQTATATSILQKVLEYLELASKVAEVVPEPHVQAISMLVDTLSADLLASPMITAQRLPAHAQLQVAANSQLQVAQAAQPAAQEYSNVTGGQGISVNPMDPEKNPQGDLTQKLDKGPALAYAPDIAKGITEPIGAPAGVRGAQPSQESIDAENAASQQGKRSPINLAWLMSQPEPGRSQILAEYGLKLS